VTRRSILIFAAGAVSASTVFVIILLVNAPVRRGVYFDLYTGDERRYSETVFSSVTEKVESPNHAWAVEHGVIDPMKRSGGCVHLAHYRKPWFGRGLCVDYVYFDVVRAIRQRKAWSEEEKISRLKEYHADLNARPNVYFSRVMKKWSKLVWPGEPNPSNGADAETPSVGDASDDE
jgi:hypothetical protein